MQHTVDTNLLIQDSHIHIMIYAIVAALLTVIILGLELARVVARHHDRRGLRPPARSTSRASGS